MADFFKKVAHNAYFLLAFCLKMGDFWFKNSPKCLFLVSFCFKMDDFRFRGNRQRGLFLGGVLL